MGPCLLPQTAPSLTSPGAQPLQRAKLAESYSLFLTRPKGACPKTPGAGQRAAEPEESAVRWVQDEEEQQHPCVAHSLWRTDLRSPVA